MNEQEFQDKLGELMSQIDSLPSEERDRLQQIAEQTKDRHSKMRQTIGDLQESLDYLRLSVKYLVFDLEATRRENQYLRKLIDASTDDEEREGEE
jgi:BMFP domain-containing protein YqiC